MSDMMQTYNEDLNDFERLAVESALDALKDALLERGVSLSNTDPACRAAEALAQYIVESRVGNEVRIPPDGIEVFEFARKLRLTSAKVIQSLYAIGIMATLTQRIDFETASRTAEAFGFKPVQA